MNSSSPANTPPNAESIFHAALDLPVAEREAYVAGQCGDDAALHARVLRLLVAYEASDDFLKTAMISPENRPGFGKSLAEMSGELIGPYRLVQQIGEGGFGVVWLAEQEQPVKRQVALKIIRLGMNTEEVIARFSQERQALAVMDHPNIAKVFDAGATPTGRPFFVMELVRGEKITTYCDEHGLSTEQRLELFVQVCHAVQHAHQKGIIHRGLKPSNILVAEHDGQAVPKVIGFGVAKATGEERLAEVSLRTMADQMVGTPLYMSPEQASLGGSDIDTRSDIYSLGVLLYEMLTGRPPFDAKTLMAAGFDEMRRIIREVEPPRPSARLTTLAGEDLETTARLHGSEPRKLTSVLRGDLDWIVMKAIEKDRARRYESANGLARDIARHLNSEPVNARPPSTGYRVRRWVKRNKLAFAAGTSIAAALLIGMGLTTWQAIRAMRAEHEQSRLRKTAEMEAARSAQTSKFLQSILGAVDPRISEGRDTALLRDMLDLAAERITVELKGQPEVEADLRSTIGDAYLSISEHEKAEKMFAEALRLRRMVHGPEHLDVSWSLFRLGRAHAFLNKHDEAVALIREGLSMRRNLLPKPDLSTAIMLDEFNWSLNATGQSEEAVRLARESLEIRTRLCGARSFEVAKSHTYLGAALWRAGDLPGGEAEASKSVALMRELGDGNSPSLANSISKLGKIQLSARKFPEAETSFREAAAISAALGGRDSVKVADVLLDLGYALTAQDEWGEAEKLAQEALAIYQARKGSFFTGEYWALQSLSRILIKRGDYAAAEPVARQMVEWQLRNNAKDPAAAAKAIDNLVDVLKAAGKTEEAEVERSRAAAIRQSSAKPPPSPASEVWNEGQQAARKGDWVKAAAAMTDAVAADSKLLGKSYTNVMRLASVLVESGDLDGYRKLCASLTEAAANAKDRNTAVSLARTGLLLPNTELPLEECSRLTAIALQSGSGEFNWPWTLAINALNEYRCERFENAASAAAQSLADPRCHVACRPLAAPVLAMAQFRAGRIDVARIALQAAEEEHRKGWFDDTRKDLGTFWYDWLVGHILLREARGLIEGTASPASQAQ